MQLDKRCFRRYAISAVLASALLASSSSASAQIPTVNDVTSTPVPGSGHDYIRALAETVNPVNGSLSIRVHPQLPDGRGLSLPFAFTYDSNGFLFPSGAESGTVTWLTNSSAISRGGWAYSVPFVTFGTGDYVDPNSEYGANCQYWTNYVFQDPDGGRHALGLLVWDSGSVSLCQQIAGVPTEETTNGGDDLWNATIADPATCNCENDVWAASADGTVYHFPRTNAQAIAGQAEGMLPDWIEDRNGNRISVTSQSGGAFQMSDTLGRTLLASSGFGSSGDTVAVSGLAQPYSVGWTSASYSYDAGWTNESTADSYCPNTVPLAAGAVPVVSSITLPNGRFFQFQYNAQAGTQYGLVNSITYPSGAKVTYTWGLNASSELAVNPDSQGNPDACAAEFSTPAVMTRVVSLGGTPVLEQDFSYYTHWTPTSTWVLRNKSA